MFLTLEKKFPTVLTHQLLVSIGNLKIPFTPLIALFCLYLSRGKFCELNAEKLSN